jgi:hypothetical protein
VFLGCHRPCTEDASVYVTHTHRNNVEGASGSRIPNLWNGLYVHQSKTYVIETEVLISGNDLCGMAATQGQPQIDTLSRRWPATGSAVGAAWYRKRRSAGLQCNPLQKAGISLLALMPPAESAIEDQQQARRVLRMASASSIDNVACVFCSSRTRSG